MKTRTHLSLFATLLLSIPPALMAQTAPQHDAHQGYAGMQMQTTPEDRAKMANTMFDKIDTNKDGLISRAEFVAHHRDMKMDHRMHGMQHTEAGSSHADIEHSTMDHTGHGNSTAPTFAQLDVNKDGKLSKAEMAKHPMAGHFSMMDKNKDGFLSASEFASH